MKTLRRYLSDQGLTEFVDEIDVLEAKCRSMDQYIQHLEGKVNNIRLELAARAMQGLLSCETENFNQSAEDLAKCAVEQADALLAALDKTELALSGKSELAKSIIVPENFAVRLAAQGFRRIFGS